jgi:hypothetical protein
MLVSKHPDWNIIVKIHPLEKEPNLYHNGLNLPGIKVVGNETRLDDILAISKIQISIYSTTFFDALGFDVVNFSLQNYSSSSDYAADMVNEGIAHPLGADEDPVEKFNTLRRSSFSTMPRSEVYGELNPAAITALLK